MAHDIHTMQDHVEGLLRLFAAGNLAVISKAIDEWAIVTRGSDSHPDCVTLTVLGTRQGKQFEFDLSCTCNAAELFDAALTTIVAATEDTPAPTHTKRAQVLRFRKRTTRH